MLEAPEISKLTKSPIERVFNIDRETAVANETRTIPLSFSSEREILQWNWEVGYFYLILDHSAESVNLDRMNDGGALLWMHDPYCQIGVVESAEVRDGKGYATVRFSDSEDGEENYRDVLNGIKRNVSFKASLHSIDAELGADGKMLKRDDIPVYRSRDWEVTEISLVSIPADHSIGVGRSQTEEKQITRQVFNLPVPIEAKHNQLEKQEMSKENETVETQPNAQPAQVNTISRLDEFKAIGEFFGEPELARSFALEGKSVDELKAEIRRQRTEAPQTQVPPKPVVELTEKETKKYSIARAILADANIRDGKNVNSFELEVSDEILRNLKAPGVNLKGGIMIPTNIQIGRQMQVQRAGLDTASATKGQTTVFTEFGGSLIELLRNKAKVLLLGATVLAGLQGNVSFPRQTGAGTAAWVGENPGSDVAESNLTLDNVLLSPKTLQSTTSYSRQLLAQAAIDVDALVMSDLAAINALEVDRAAIHGSGASNQPTGIYAASVNTIAFGGSVTFAKLVDMETEIALDNADMDTMAYLTTPGVKGKAKQTQEFSGTNGYAIWRDNEMNGYRAEASNQVSKTLGVGTNEHGIILGVWSELLFGEWGAMEIITDPYRLKKQGMIEVTSFMLCDIKRRHDEAFCKGTGLIP